MAGRGGHNLTAQRAPAGSTCLCSGRSRRALIVGQQLSSPLQTAAGRGGNSGC